MWGQDLSRHRKGGATWDTSGHEDRLTTIPDPTAIDPLVLVRPLVSAGMIAAELGITPRAAQDLVADLGLREMKPHC